MPLYFQGCLHTCDFLLVRFFLASHICLRKAHLNIKTPSVFAGALVSYPLGKFHQLSGVCLGLFVSRREVTKGESSRETVFGEKTRGDPGGGHDSNNSSEVQGGRGSTPSPTRPSGPCHRVPAATRYPRSFSSSRAVNYRKGSRSKG